MNLDKMLKEKRYDEIWQEYCGYLDLTLQDYMDIQHRLMLEQLDLYAECELGKRRLGNRKPVSVDQFRRSIPLSTYEDYAELLLQKSDWALPSKPLLWIKTTWEGGDRPEKWAPYTESMVECHKGTFITCMILATSSRRGEFSLDTNEKFLYGMAPLPYLTGIVPHMISEELTVDFLPSVKEAESMTFGERNKEGMKLGLEKGIDLFFGLSSVIMYITRSFSEKNTNGGLASLLKMSPKAASRLTSAWMKCRKEKRSMLPKDLWQLKGLICAGTDTKTMKDKIEASWGIKPLEIFGGTEPTCIASETWARDGLVFFPDVCFYEFIPVVELERGFHNSDYEPHTYLMDQLREGEEYELVISNLKGGAFLRYRTGDMFRCLMTKNNAEGIGLPHFQYVDRCADVIDISGFTRITEKTIKKAIRLSRVNITNWFAMKDFDEDDRAYFHLYLEMHDMEISPVVAEEVVKDHLSVYFRYVDADYKDLKKLLGTDPLVITILPSGTIDRYSLTNKRNFRKMNPSHYDVIEVLRMIGLK